jgi:hypothetical protein
MKDGSYNLSSDKLLKGKGEDLAAEDRASI